MLAISSRITGQSISAQLTVGGWYFPVSVPPPDFKDNTVYDEDVTSPKTESANVTHQEIKDYYDKDINEKWKNEKSNLKPVYGNILHDVHRHHNDNEHTSSTTQNPLEISKSKRFLSNSGIQSEKSESTTFETPITNDEPVITMTMTPILSLAQPEEISAEIIKSHDAEKTMLESKASTENVRISKEPYVYEIPMNKTFNGSMLVIDEKKDMVKLKRDVFRLRNEMNLVKALLNKLYKRMYKKQKDFPIRKSRDSATRLSAIQAEGNHDWTVFRGVLQRRNRLSE